MGTKIILDTATLVDFGRKEKNTVIQVGKLSQEHELCTTDINALELYYGAYLSNDVDKNVAAIKGLLNTLKVLSTDVESMEISGKILAESGKKDIKIGLQNILIAGICLTNSCPIITSNKKDFELMGVEIKEI